MGEEPENKSLFMARALTLASLGRGTAAPNPMVGCVIMHEGAIIGEGYHMAYGGPHAEVNAVNSVKDKSLLKKAVMYVTLEPCNHTGLTPPCTELILKHNIPRIVIAQQDPNPMVAGSGIARLIKNGVDVVCGEMEKEAKELNIRFNTFHIKKRPYIILKWAQTRDGFVDLARKKDDPIQPNWITDNYCRRLVHKWRSEEAAIMVGTETAYKDNPALNVRSWTGEDPLRIVLDQHLRLPKTLKLLDNSIPTLVYTSREGNNSQNIKIVKVIFDGNLLNTILKDLHNRSVQSVIIEGGSKLLNSFISQNLWDEARVFTGPGKFGEGVKAPDFPFKPDQTRETGNSILEIFQNKKT